MQAGLSCAAFSLLVLLARCEDDYNYNTATVESWLTLACRNAASESEFGGLSTCYAQTRVGDKSHKVGQIQWTGSDADLQGRQLGYTWYPQHADGSTTCISSDTDRYCRARRVCKMVESLKGWLTDAPAVFRESLWSLSRSNVNGYRDLQDKTVDKCVVCQFTPCGSYACPNGRVNAAPLEVVAGKVIRLPECGRACAEGTFLTCRAGQSCGYQAYTQADAEADARGALEGSRNWQRSNVVVLRVDANLVDVAKAGPPVEQCYPCKFAAWLTHYGEFASTDDRLYDEGFLRFYCPGGASGPSRCGAREVTRFEASGAGLSRCGCEPGYYKADGPSSRCAPCPAGFFCAWSGLSPPVPVECPADTYSTGGAAACEACGMDRQCEGGQALTRCKPGQGGEAKGSFQRENARCVPCQQCQQLQGPVPCYKVSPRIF